MLSACLDGSEGILMQPSLQCPLSMPPRMLVLALLNDKHAVAQAAEGRISPA